MIKILPIKMIFPEPCLSKTPMSAECSHRLLFSFHSHTELHDPCLAFFLFCKPLIKEPSQKIAVCVNCRGGPGAIVVDNTEAQAI